MGVGHGKCIELIMDKLLVEVMSNDVRPVKIASHIYVYTRRR